MDCPTHGQLNPDWTSCPFCIRDRQRTAAPAAPAFAPPGYPPGGGGGVAADTRGGGLATGGGGGFPAGGGGYAAGAGRADVTRGGGGGGGGGGAWNGGRADVTRGGGPYDGQGYGGGGGGSAGHTRIINPPESTQRRIRAWLIEKTGPRPDQVFQLRDGDTWIGRDRRNDVFIDDDAISTQHAKLWVDEKRVLRLLNASTTNGTLVNGKRVEAPIELSENDEITVGATVLVLKRIDAPIRDEPAQPPMAETIIMPPFGATPRGEA